MTPRVSIVIPTLHRTAGALAAARSVIAQECDAAFEIVFVDNDPAGGALEQLHAFADRANRHVTIVHEPRAGISNARNAGVRAAKGWFIAFLDDDQVAPVRWLSELVRVQSETKADVVFGPVSARITEIPNRHIDFFHDAFARDPHHAEGLIKALYGAGCSLIRRASLPSDEPFNPARNDIGGEDHVLFQAMQEKGAKFGWAPSAYVWEVPDTARVSLGYILKRAFSHGQGLTTGPWAAQPKRLGAVLYWMAVGLAQTIVSALVALVSFITRNERRAYSYRSLAEGLGKMFWLPVMHVRCYGAAMLPKTERGAQIVKELTVKVAA
jgi:succinoglycan biosynthesis protein ExoM